MHILLESETCLSLTYTTKIFIHITESPFWSEQIQTIKPNVATAVVAVMNQNELQYNITSSIKFTGILSFKLNDKEKVLPIENVIISALDIMGEEFDVLSNITEEDSQIPSNLLAVLATSIKTDLRLRCIQEKPDGDIDILNTFCRYLLMERIPETHNIVIRRGSPCHMLKGVMIILQAGGPVLSMGTWITSVYTR